MKMLKNRAAAQAVSHRAGFISRSLSTLRKIAGSNSRNLNLQTQKNIKDKFLAWLMVR